MGSLKDCMNFQEDLRGLLFDGSNLEKEDSCLFDFISNLENPRGVLDHSRKFKDEGNSTFKDGDFDIALENYGLSCVFLSCLVLQEEDVRISFSQLATSTVLNMAATLLKKNEFRQVGHLCSVILNFNPENVKALFRRASAAMGLGKNELASWDLKLAHEVEPSNLEVVKKLREVEMLLHEPPHEHGQGKDKRMKYSKGTSVSDTEENKEVASQDQKERLSCIDIGNYTRMKVESNDGRINVEELNHVMGDSKPKEVEMSERVEDNEVKDKENRSNPELTKHKYHFHNRRRPESALVISKRDYHLLAKGRTLQHFNPRSGIVMSIRVKGSSQETSRQLSESQSQQNSHSPPMEKYEHIPHNDSITHNTEGLDTRNLSMENSLSEPEEVKREHVTGGSPTLQDCSSDDVSIEPSHLCFRSITTGNRNPTRRTKNQAPKKGVLKEKRIKRKNPTCAISNHVFQCRSKVEARITHYDHPPLSCQNLPSYRSGMKRKSTFSQSPELPQQPKKLVIVKNANCNICSTSDCKVPLQVATVNLAKISAYS